MFLPLYCHGSGRPIQRADLRSMELRFESHFLVGMCPTCCHVVRVKQDTTTGLFYIYDHDSEGHHLNV